jgi:hypothetical protein
MADEKVLRKYEVPVAGRVNLIHAPNCEFHGPYYARVENYGLAGRRSQTEDEARFRAGVEIQNWLEVKRHDLEKKLEPIKNVLSRMSVNSVKLTLLDDFQVQ